MKRKEVEDLRLKSNESEAKVGELTVRLENQTLEVLRLQTELEEYEYEDAMGSAAVGSGGGGGGGDEGGGDGGGVGGGGGGGYW